MSPLVAHIAGVPVEEALLMLGPALLAGGAVGVASARAAIGGRLRRSESAAKPWSPHARDGTPRSPRRGARGAS